MTAANYQKVITALFDTSDAAVWLRKPGGDEYTAAELASYKKQKIFELVNRLKAVDGMVAAGQGRAEALFSAFNADLKTLTVPASREAMRLLLLTEVALSFGEDLYAGSDEKKKEINAASLTTQALTRALLSRSDFSAGGAKLFIGRPSSNVPFTHLLPTPQQRADLTQGSGALSQSLATAIDRATAVWAKGYKNAMDPVIAVRQGEVLAMDTAKIREDIAKIDTNIAKGREDIENIQKIGTARENINKLLRALMNEPALSAQKRLVQAYNAKFAEFQGLRATLQRDNSDEKIGTMLGSINADVAIIRSHPGLKPFDSQLKKFTLAAD